MATSQVGGASTVVIQQQQGGTCDHTAEFIKIREEHKQLISEIFAKKMDFLDKASKKEPNTFPLSTLLFTPSDHYCIGCGQPFHIFNKEIICCVCQKSFCTSCVRRFTDKEILEIIQSTFESSVFSCEKCSDVLVCQKEKEIRRKFRALKDQSVVNEAYNNVTRVKDQIKQLLPQYDYLATSITEIKITGTTERDDTSFGLSYPQAKLKEKKLLILIKEFEEAIKHFETIPANTDVEKIIQSNIKSSNSLFLQSTLISFQEIQRKVAKVELKAVTHIYVFLRRLEFETRANTDFSLRFKKTLDDLSEHVLRETNQICTVQGQMDWDNYKSRIDDRIKGHQKLVVTTPSKALFPPRENKTHKETVSSIPQPMLLRRVTALVGEKHKRFLTRGIHAPMTAKVLSFILQKLEKGYDDGLVL